MDAWATVDAVKAEKGGDFALDDVSPGAVRRRTWVDEVEVEYFDDGSTSLDTLDSLDARPGKCRGNSVSPDIAFVAMMMDVYM